MCVMIPYAHLTSNKYPLSPKRRRQSEEGLEQPPTKRRRIDDEADDTEEELESSIQRNWSDPEISLFEQGIYSLLFYFVFTAFRSKHIEEDARRWAH